MPTQQRFEGPNLEALLARVRTELGDDIEIKEANKVHRGGLGGFFAKESYEVVVEAPDAADDAEEEPFEPLSLLELAERVSDTESAPVRADFNTVLDRTLAEDRWPASAAINAVQEMSAPLPAVPTLGQRTRVIERWDLERLGLPGDLLRQPIAKDRVHSELVRALEQLPMPDPLPRLPGSVIAVIGDRDDALELARVIATELDAPESSIVLASTGARARVVPAERRLTDLATVTELRRSWRRRRRPTVVAADAAISARRQAWTCDLLDALEPAMTWASVEATRKPEDIAAWARSIGGVDALGVTGLDETASPAAVLRTNIPIGRLDRRPATPSSWAALLTERIAV